MVPSQSVFYASLLLKVTWGVTVPELLGPMGSLQQVGLLGLGPFHNGQPLSRTAILSDVHSRHAEYRLSKGTLGVSTAEIKYCG